MGLDRLLLGRDAKAENRWEGRQTAVFVARKEMILGYSSKEER